MATYRIINNNYITYVDTLSDAMLTVASYNMAMTSRSLTIGAHYIDIDLAHCTYCDELLIAA